MSRSEDAPLLEGHISRAFDGDLLQLQLQVTTMGGLVLRQVVDAVAAYAQWSEDLAATVTAREPDVDATERRIEDEALSVIARRQPMALDLRAVLSFERVVANLERMGDEAHKVALVVLANSTRDLAPAVRPSPATARDVQHLGALATQMVRGAVEAFDAMDAVAAGAVVQKDRELDQEYAAGLRRLLTRAMEDPRQIQGAIQSAFVLKSIERMGDHARNIGRQVAGLVTQVAPTAEAASPSSAVR